MGGGEGDAGGEPRAPGSEPATLHIRRTNGSKFAVRTDLGVTVAAFKAIVAESGDVPALQQRLIYKGRILKDDQTLASYGVETDHTIHMVRGAVPPPPAATSPSDSNEATATTRVSSPAGSLGGLLQGLGTAGSASSGGLGLFGSGLPELDQMKQQLAENPNMMREIMNTPLMQNLLGNPDLIRNLIMNNPRMRELIDQNPDLAHVLNDPSILRQTVEAARSPELMREMMRNTDRAMSNIESSPEGFNMLRRMYETVQEPFLNATTMGGEGDRNQNPFAAAAGNQGSNTARDPAANVATAASDSSTGSPSPNTNPLPNPWSTTSGSARGAVRPSPARPASTARSVTPTATTGGLLGLSAADLQSMLDDDNDASFLNQQLCSLQQSLGPLMSPLGQQQVGQERTQGGTGAGNVGLNALMSMLSGLGGGGGGLGVPNASNVPAEELYASQLAQLQEMGFFDTQENLRALIATAGNVHSAVERLLGNLGQWNMLIVLTCACD